jgi:hypothetical protein
VARRILLLITDLEIGGTPTVVRELALRLRDDVAGALKAGERLLPQMLRDRGYATGGVVSSGLLRRDTGIAQGSGDAYGIEHFLEAIDRLIIIPIGHDGRPFDALAADSVSAVILTRYGK